MSGEKARQYQESPQGPGSIMDQLARIMDNHDAQQIAKPEGDAAATEMAQLSESQESKEQTISSLVDEFPGLVERPEDVQSGLHGQAENADIVAYRYSIRNGKVVKQRSKTAYMIDEGELVSVWNKNDRQSIDSYREHMREVQALQETKAPVISAGERRILEAAGAGMTDKGQLVLNGHPHPSFIFDEKVTVKDAGRGTLIFRSGEDTLVVGTESFQYNGGAPQWLDPKFRRNAVPDKTRSYNQANQQEMRASFKPRSNRTKLSVTPETQLAARVKKISETLEENFRLNLSSVKGADRAIRSALARLEKGGDSPREAEQRLAQTLQQGPAVNRYNIVQLLQRVKKPTYKIRKKGGRTFLTGG